MASQNPQPEAAVLIEMKDVHKQFGNGTVALRGMSLQIRKGEFVSFLGPSGCGKSTALKMISGLLLVSSGSISVNGHPAGQSSDGNDIGYVFQEATLMPWATVHENVYLPLKLHGLSRSEAKPRVEEALAMVGLANFAASYPRELSGGMKMRVSIARALVTRPR
ncbi:MAG: ABC transporter ATP-binding protein, partial [Rhizobiaceae bacterium]